MMTKTKKTTESNYTLFFAGTSLACIILIIILETQIHVNQQLYEDASLKICQLKFGNDTEIALKQTNAERSITIEYVCKVPETSSVIEVTTYKEIPLKNIMKE